MIKNEVWYLDEDGIFMFAYKKYGENHSLDDTFGVYYLRYCPFCGHPVKVIK